MSREISEEVETISEVEILGTTGEIMLITIEAIIMVTTTLTIGTITIKFNVKFVTLGGIQQNFAIKSIPFFMIHHQQLIIFQVITITSQT